LKNKINLENMREDCLRELKPRNTIITEEFNKRNIGLRLLAIRQINIMQFYG